MRSALNLDMKIDTSFLGIVKAIFYGLVCTYSWLDSTGINAYVFTVLLGFMTLDMVLGWCKASVVKSLESPTSKKAKKGILAKSIMFVIPVVVGFVWGIFDQENAMKIVNTQLIALTIAEGYSNIANAYAIYTKEELSEFDAVTFVFKKLLKTSKNYLVNYINNES